MNDPRSDARVSQCGLFDFMAKTIGISVLHPGGYKATKQLCSMLGLRKEHRVLDLACGSGTSSIFINKHHGCSVTGIDLSPELIAKAQKKNRHNEKLQFMTGDARKLPFPDASFDAVIAQAFFILIDDKDTVLNEIYRVLKPGGHFGSLELSWFMAPTKKAYNELLDKTCHDFIPRVKPFAGWEDLFASKKFLITGLMQKPMTQGMGSMLAAEGPVNFFRIMRIMLGSAAVRRKMTAVQKTFSKYRSCLGYGLFAMQKEKLTAGHGMFPVDEYKTILSRIKTLVRESEDVSAIRLSPDKWTLGEMAAHLIDSAANNHQRFIRLQLEKTLAFPAYDAQTWVSISGAEGFDFRTLTALWESYNLYLLHIIEHVHPESLEHVWEAGEKRITLKELIEDYYRHLGIHETLYRERIAELRANT
jgi:ubiquinone/menaquinone biosynthesis C-methylase UbiE